MLLSKKEILQYEFDTPYLHLLEGEIWVEQYYSVELVKYLVNECFTDDAVFYYCDFNEPLTAALVIETSELKDALRPEYYVLYKMYNDLNRVLLAVLNSIEEV